MSFFERWRHWWLIPSSKEIQRGAHVRDFTDAPQRARRRRRGGEAAPKKPFLAEQLPWGPATYLDDPTQPVDAEGVEAIHNASMRILEDIGILFLNDDALDVLKAAGCDVDYETKRVRMDRGFVTEMAEKAPAQFTITAQR